MLSIKIFIPTTINPNIACKIAKSVYNKPVNKIYAMGGLRIKQAEIKLKCFDPKPDLDNASVGTSIFMYKNRPRRVSPVRSIFYDKKEEQK